MNILYQDAALVVVEKPAGLSSEEGMTAALRQHWDTPDAFVGVVHRLDTGVSGLMVFARTPAAAAALSRQITQSQEAYAVQDGRAEGRAEAPCFVKQYRAVLSGGPNDALPAAGTLRDWLFKDSRRGRVFPVSRPRKGVREAVLEYRIVKTAGEMSLAHRPHSSDPGAVCLPEASPVGRRQIRQPCEGCHCPAELRSAVRTPGHRQDHELHAAAAGHCPLESVRGMMPRLGENDGTIQN